MITEPEVQIDSNADIYPHLYQTLVLLKLDRGTLPSLFMVVEGMSSKDTNPNETGPYFYNEHTCPTNFLRVPVVSVAGDMDPHGVFEFVRAVWMPRRYVEIDESASRKRYLGELFPELTGATIHVCLEDGCHELVESDEGWCEACFESFFI